LLFWSGCLQFFSLLHQRTWYDIGIGSYHHRDPALPVYRLVLVCYTVVKYIIPILCYSYLPVIPSPYWFCSVGHDTDDILTFIKYTRKVTLHTCSLTDDTINILPGIYMSSWVLGGSWYWFRACIYYIYICLFIRWHDYVNFDLSECTVCLVVMRFIEQYILHLWILGDRTFSGETTAQYGCRRVQWEAKK